MLKNTMMLGILFSASLGAQNSNQFSNFITETVDLIVGAPNLTVLIEEAQALQQHQKFGRRNFNDAFIAAVTSIVTDRADHESPLAIAEGVCEENENFSPSCPQKLLRQFLNNTSSYLFMVELSDLPDFAPMRGEKIEDNWIFLANIPELSDHIYYVIVPRDYTETAYVYGFN